MTHSRIANIIVVCAVALIPLLYAGLLSSAYQDPVERIGAMTAAVVNLDQPHTTTADGTDTTLALGDELEERLTHPTSTDDVGFTWVTMSQDDARKALTTEDIRAYLVIPENFSATAATLADTNSPAPDPTQLTIITDDAVNYLAGTMARTVAASLQGSLSQQSAQQYIDTVLVSLGTIHNKTEDAADGSEQLHAGADELHTGVVTLAEAAASAHTGASQLATGAADLSTGTTTLAHGAHDLAHGAASASTGAQQLADGAHNLANGTADLSTGASALATGTNALNTTIPSLTHGTQALATGATTAATGAQEAANGATHLHQGITNYTAGVDQLAESITTLTTRSDTLNTGASHLVKGSSNLAQGATTVADGATQAATSAAELAASQHTLDARSQELSATLTDLADQCNDLPEAGAEHLCAQLHNATTQHQQIAVGITQGANATQVLAEGVTKVADGAHNLQDGATALSTGANEIASAIGLGKQPAATTVRGALHHLDTGASTLTASSATIRNGASALADAVEALAEGTQGLADGASQLSGQAPQLASGVTQLHKGATAVAGGAATVDHGAQTLAQGTGTLTDGVTHLAQGAGVLADGVTSAQAGASQLAQGILRLNSGMGSLDTGANTLAQGAERLSSGAGDLSDALDQGARDIPAFTEEQAQDTADAAANLADVTAERENAVHNAAGGFGPMFFALALWIGGIAIYLVMPALDRRHSTAEKWWWSAARPMLVGGVLGLLQAALAVLVGNWLVDIHAMHVGRFVGIAMIASVTFVAVNQALVALLSYRGRFVSLLLLVLQITSMGGTFPVETAPRFFGWVHEALPMTWVHYAFRASIAGQGIDDVWGRAVTHLVVWWAVAVVVTFVMAWVRSGRRPLPHDHANTADMIDEVHAPYGTGELEPEDVNPMDELIDDAVGAQGDERERESSSAR